MSLLHATVSAAVDADVCMSRPPSFSNEVGFLKKTMRLRDFCVSRSCLAVPCRARTSICNGHPASGVDEIQQLTIALKSRFGGVANYEAGGRRIATTVTGQGVRRSSRARCFTARQFQLVAGATTSADQNEAALVDETREVSLRRRGARLREGRVFLVRHTCPPQKLDQAAIGSTEYS